LYIVTRAYRLNRHIIISITRNAPRAYYRQYNADKRRDLQTCIPLQRDT